MFQVQKTKTNVIRGELDNYKNRDFVNLRVWYQDKSGDYCPGKQGITIPPGKVVEVIEGLQAIVETPEFAKLIKSA